MPNRCCPECGAEQIDMVTMGDLEVQYSPPHAYFAGVRMNFSFGEARLLYTLVRRRMASSDALAILPGGEYSGQESVRSRLTSIRKKLVEVGAPFSIVAIRNYGYEIKEIKP